MFEIKDQSEGFVLPQVLAAMVILALLASSVLEVIAVSRLWIAQGAEKTKAAAYAGSIIETIRAHSSEIASLGLTRGTSYEADDKNPGDEVFAFVLDPDSGEITVNAPAELKAALIIKSYVADDYYAADINPVLEDNLYEIDVIITGVQTGKKIAQMSTVAAAR